VFEYIHSVEDFSLETFLDINRVFAASPLKKMNNMKVSEEANPGYKKCVKTPGSSIVGGGEDGDGSGLAASSQEPQLSSWPLGLDVESFGPCILVLRWKRPKDGSGEGVMIDERGG